MKPKVITTMRRCCMGEVEHDTKVTRIGQGWNLRVFLNGEVNQEVRVCDRAEIGKEIKSMLRWEDKCGNFSPMASASRDRIK